MAGPASRRTSGALPRSRRDFVRTAGLGAAGWVAAGWLPTASAAGGPVGAWGVTGKLRQEAGLLIRRGQVVTAEGRFEADIRVRDGVVAEIGRRLDRERERVIEADGLLVLPGGIDPHAHLTQRPSVPERFRLADDLKSGSEAALAGGITTIGNMTVPAEDETVEDALRRDVERIGAEAIVDVMLHPVIRDPTALDEPKIRDLVAAGHTSIKVFMVLPAFDRNVRDYLRVMRMASRAGMLTMMHCEDYAIIAEATTELVSLGKSSLRYYAESRPVLAEVVATRRAVGYSEATGAPIYVVHLSSAVALEVCREAQSRRLPVFVETRPLYLHLTSERYEGPDGPLYVAQPPLRESDDAEALWEGLREGAVHTLGTDHVGWSRVQKLDPALGVEDLRPGVPNLQAMLPMLYSEGVVGGRISLERFVAITSANPARLFGFFPRKGTIAVGSDADLVLWDATEGRTIQAGDMYSRAGYSLYEGTEVVGWPRLSVRRGQVAFEEGRIVAEPGSGRLLQRGRSQAPLR